MNIDKLKRAIEKQQERRSKAEGANEQILASLEKQHGVKTVKAAKKLLEQKEQLEEKLGKKLAQQEKELEKKWKKQISELEEE